MIVGLINVEAQESFKFSGARLNQETCALLTHSAKFIQISFFNFFCIKLVQNAAEIAFNGVLENRSSYHCSDL